MDKISAFLSAQTDCFEFNLGVFFIFLAALAAVIHFEKKNKTIGWHWFASFAVFQAFFHWSVMLARLLEGAKFPVYMEVVFAAASYLFLGIFVYSWIKGQGRIFAKWVLLIVAALFAISPLFLIGGLAFFQNAIRYSIITPIILTAAALFFVEGVKAKGKAGRCLYVSGAGMLAYMTLVAGYPLHGFIYARPFLTCAFADEPFEGPFRVIQMLSVLAVVVSLWNYLGIREMADVIWPGWKTLRRAGALLVVVVIIVGAIITNFLGGYTQNQLAFENENYLEAVAHNMEYELGDGDDATISLAENPDIRDFFVSSADGKLQKIEAILNNYQESFHLSLCYLMDKNGVVLASSNPFAMDSLVGRAYPEKKYLKQAVSGYAGRDIGYGIHQGFFGYYSARPVFHEKKVIGVVAAKNSLGSALLGIGNPVALVDDEGRLLIANESFYKEYGKDVPSSELLFENSILKKFTGEGYLHIERKLGDGRWRFLIFYSDEIVSYFKLFGRTITLLFVVILMLGGYFMRRFKMSELKIAKNEEKYILAVNGSNDGIWDWNLKTNELYLSSRWKGMIGYLDDELPNVFASFEDRIHPEDHARLFQYVERYMDGKEGKYNIEFRLHHKDGSYRWIMARGEALRDDLGRPYRMAGSHTDITERKNFEMLLEEKSNFLENLIDSIPSPVFYKDAKLRYLGCNAAFEKNIGTSREFVVEKTDYDLLPKDFADTYHKKDLDLMSSPGVQTYETEIRYTDEINHNVIFSKATFEDSKGNLGGIIGVMQDVTEMRRAELSAEKNRERLAVTLRSIGDGVVATDADGRVRILNSVAEELTGWKEAQAIGLHIDNVMKLVNEFTDELVENPAILALREKKKVEMANHTVLISRDGRRFVLEDSAAPIFGIGGTIEGVVIVFRDATERKKLEKLLKESEERFRGIASNIPGMVYRCKNDDEYTMEFISGETVFITGYDVKDFLNNAVRSYSSIIYSEDLAMVRSVINEGASRKRVYDLKYRIVKKGGEISWVHEKGRAVYDDEGAFVCLDGVILDMNREKEAEEKLKEKNEELGRLYNIKSEFTSMVSHELRTPLSAIKEGLAIVSEGVAGKLNHDQYGLIDIARRNVDRLHRMIDSILDFSKLESGHGVMDVKLGDISKTIEGAAKLQEPLVLSHGLSMELHLDTGLPKVLFDEDKMAQVMNNLISNAIKFTKQGKISISAVEFENSILVSIADTGMGISETDMPKLFHKFEQLGLANRITGGTGLGLAISEKIVEQHGGRIWAESEEGKGSKFCFTIPLEVKAKS
jgi:PAS domain S-box-containing protein